MQKRKEIHTFILHAGILVMAILFVFCMHIRAFAASDPFSDELSGLQSDFTRIIDSMEDGESRDSADKLKALTEALKKADLENMSNPKDAVEKVIVDVLNSDDVKEKCQWSSDGSSGRVMLMQEWANQFAKEVAVYGYSAHNYEITYSYVGTNDDGSFEQSGITEGSGSADSDVNKTLNSSGEIQKLRWDKKDSKSKINVSDFLSKFETAFGTVSVLLQSIAAALVIAFGCSNLLRMSSDRMVSSDAITREFVKIIFGLWFIFNYRYFTILVLRVGTFFTESFLDITNQTNNIEKNTAYTMRYCLWKALYNMMENGKADTWFKGISSAATGVLGFVMDKETLGDKIGDAISQLFGGIAGFTLGGTIVNLAVNWVAFAVLIELGVRYVFTPIAIADLYNDGYRSNGARWLKKMCACALTGGLVFLTIYGCNILKSMLTGLHPIQDTAINLTMCGSFVKMRQIADEIIGVR